MVEDNIALLNRLRACLTTILELEETLHKSPLGGLLESELMSLRQVLENIEDVTIKEEDVMRIEVATSRFLEELKVPLQGMTVYQPTTCRILQ